MKITAVLVSYWKERRNNITRIVHALKAGSVKPDKIIIFNNNKDLDLGQYSGNIEVSIINSGKNFGHRARFIACLLEPSDYYYFIDDDMCPNKFTLEYLRDNATPDTCLTFFGRRVGVHARFRSSLIDKPKMVDYAEGVGSIFCSQKAILKGLELDQMLQPYPEYNNGREADIVLSMANKTKVLPTDESTSLIDIGQKGVGMFKTHGHEKMRNSIIKKIIEIKGGESL